MANMACAANPAKLIEQGKYKGKIARGFDADLIVFVMTKNNLRFLKDDLHHKHKITPYLNERIV